MRYVPLFFAALLITACDEPTTFQTDPLCASCIAQACHSATGEHSLQAHFNTLSDENKAQVIALMEAEKGCFEQQPWAKEEAAKAYQTWPSAFYRTTRPMYETTVLHALDEVLNHTEAQDSAMRYLNAHFDEWKTAGFANAKIDELQQHTDDDFIFPLLVQLADKEGLEKLASLEPTQTRDMALIYRWKELGVESQKRALEAWVSAEWHIQTSGSAQLPQYLTLDWTKRPFPDGVPEFTAVLTVDSIKIQNNEVQRKGWSAREVFAWPPLKEANTRHARLDLTPWLSSADTYKIRASATMEIWPDNAPEACHAHEEQCDMTPVLTEPIVLDKSYRVFVGVETGSPNRVKQDNDNLKTKKAIQIEICNEDSCLSVWKDGNKTKDRTTKLAVHQGQNFYMNVMPGDADLPMASRLMARTGNNAAWQEIAVFFAYAPQKYHIPVRADIFLGNLCNHQGDCKLELQLRPSLRMARRDPRFSKYWGSTLELGTITLDMLDQTPQQMTN